MGLAHNFCRFYKRQQDIMIKNIYQIKIISVYGEFDLMVEHRTQFAFKGKREHIANINMPNIAYPNQQINIEIPHGSRDHVIVPIPSKLRLTFTLHQQTRHVVL